MYFASTEEVTQAAYETFQQCQSTLDHYHWLAHDYALGLGGGQQVMGTADHIIDEFASTAVAVTCTTSIRR